jgi:hypothetical protein
MCAAAALFLPTVMIRNLNVLSYLSGLGVLSSVPRPPRRCPARSPCPRPRRVRVAGAPRRPRAASA